jgi:hypothetical protein
VPVLTEILARYPVVEAEPSEADHHQDCLSVEVPATKATVVDLASWVVPSKVPSVRPGPEPAEVRSTTDIAVKEQMGPSWRVLLKQRENLPMRGRRRQQLPVEEQGALFTLRD